MDERQTDCPPHHDFAVTVPPDDFVIGWCCLRISKGDGRIGELMYVLNRGFWGRGYATEAARGVLGYGFSGLELHRIYATCRRRTPLHGMFWRSLGCDEKVSCTNTFGFAGSGSTVTLCHSGP